MNCNKCKKKMRKNSIGSTVVKKLHGGFRSGKKNHKKIIAVCKSCLKATTAKS